MRPTEEAGHRQRRQWLIGGLLGLGFAGAMILLFWGPASLRAVSLVASTLLPALFNQLGPATHRSASLVSVTTFALFLGYSYFQGHDLTQPPTDNLICLLWPILFVLAYAAGELPAIRQYLARWDPG